MSSIEARSELAGVNKTLPTIAWVLCVVGVWPVGLIIAYVDRGKTTELYSSHYRYLIRTVWIAMLFGFVSLLLSVVAIGLVTWFATVLWYLVRCVKGLVLLLRDEPISNPATWLV
jgi:uncharacterized membrane protein